jgi:K+/H+ antiporter YhaU regulatory subunit KhtT
MVSETIIKPIYQQIAIDIASRIHNGEFEVGTKIHGRSTLAGEYKVSPETIRRAVVLLQDTNIVKVSQGSGIEVTSREEALKFINRFKNIDSMNSLKSDINKIIEEKRRLDNEMQKYIDKLIDYSERFKNTNPFAPIEVTITSKSKLLGKTISETNFWQNTGATIIGIRRANTTILSPGPYTIFMEGDTFIMVGDEGVFDRVKMYMYE